MDNNMLYINFICDVDVVVIVFCFIDFIVKLVYGYCDDLFLILCVVCLVYLLLMVVLVMNVEMW